MGCSLEFPDPGQHFLAEQLYPLHHLMVAYARLLERQVNDTYAALFMKRLQLLCYRVRASDEAYHSPDAEPRARWTASGENLAPVEWLSGAGRLYRPCQSWAYGQASLRPARHQSFKQRLRLPVCLCKADPSPIDDLVSVRLPARLPAKLDVFGGDIGCVLH